MNTDKDELRIKVAELCGWKQREAKGISAFDAACYGGVPKVWVRNNVEHDQLPDYPGDLNACQELWNVIRDKGLWDEYCTWLEITVRANKGTACHKIFFYCADADEHCVTFVKTMEGK